MGIDWSNKLKLHYVPQHSYNLEAKPSNRNSNINQKRALHNNWGFNKNKCIEAKQLTLCTLLNKQTHLNICCNREIFLEMMDSNLSWELSFTIKSALLFCWISQFNKYLWSGWYALEDNKIKSMKFSLLIL